MHPVPDVAEVEHPGRAVLARWAHLAGGRPALRDPHLPESLGERLHQRYDAPRADELASFLVGRQLDSAELEVEMAPVEHADLLLARRGVAGQRPRDRVLGLNRYDECGEL